MTMFISMWVLLVTGLICLLPMLYTRGKEHTALEEKALARLDNHGSLRLAEEVQAELVHERVMPRVLVRKHDLSLVTLKL
jgi:hypothetical protein